MLRGLGFCAALAAGAALACAPPATASTTQRSILFDDDQLLYRGPQVADQTLTEVKALGVDTVKVSVLWELIAPARDSPDRPAGFDATDPAQYERSRLEPYDHLVESASRLGLGVVFDVVGPAPLWASGKRKGRAVNGVYRPDPAALQDFVIMLGRRYDGTGEPRVSMWSIWNEPNYGAQIQPQRERDPINRGLKVPASPQIYRYLARAMLAGLSATGHGGDTLLLGETYPGARSAQGRGRSVSPAVFLRELFCLDSQLQPLRPLDGRRIGCDYARNGPLRVSAFAHHPYTFGAPPSSSDPDPENASLVDSGRIKRILDAAGRAGRIPRNLPIWYTEFGYETNPPDPFRGVPPDRQAAYLSQVELLTTADPRIGASTQFLLRDALGRDQFPVTDPRHWVTYQSGLEFSDGTPKPSYDAYRLPLVALPRAPGSSAVPLWGFVRAAPAGQAQTVAVQFRPDGAQDFSPASGPVRTDPNGYFVAQVSPPGPGDYRFTWKADAPPPAQASEGAGALIPGLALPGSSPGAPAPVAAAPTYTSAPVHVP